MIHYVVTAGEYSDYHIKAVFSDKAKAKEYCETFGGNVEEYPDTVEVPRALLWSAVAYIDGDVRTEELGSSEPDQIDESYDIQNWRGEDEIRNQWKPGSGNAGEQMPGVQRYGETEELAKKNAFDALRKAKAKLAGIA